MDIFDNLANGIVAVVTPMNLLLLFAGVMLGMVVGVMPGLGPSAGLAILLPAHLLASTRPARSSCSPPSTTARCTAAPSRRC